MENKIAIISDAHNNLTNLKKVLDYCLENRIAKIICCGDLASNEALDFLNDNFEGEIFHAIGNAEEGQLVLPELGHWVSKGIPSVQGAIKYKKTKVFPELGEAKIAGKNVAFVHFPDMAKELAKSGKYDFVFHGHTHKPWIEKINNCEVLNPGNVAGEIYPPTFAVWDTDNNKSELIRIHEIK